MEYERSETTNDLLLASIAECDRSGICVPPTRFDYTLGGSLGNSGAAPNTPLRLSATELETLNTPDLNGDGLPDLVFVGDEPVEQLGQGDSGQPEYIKFEHPIRYAYSQGKGEYSSLESVPVSTDGYQVRVGDPDGDGRADVLLVGGEPEGAPVGNVTSFSRVIQLHGPSGGGGSTELASFGTIFASQIENNCESLEPGTPPPFCLANQMLDVAVLDLDGDGADELLACTRVYHAVPPQHETYLSLEESAARWRVVNGTNLGDALPEPVFDIPCAVECEGPTCKRQASYQIADLTGDGKMDLLQVSPMLPENVEDLDPSQSYRYVALGAQFPDNGYLPELEFQLPADLFQRYNRVRGEESEDERTPFGAGRDLWADVNGDGLADVVRFEPVEGGVWSDAAAFLDEHFFNACKDGADLPAFEARVSAYINRGDGRFVRTLTEDPYSAWSDYCDSFQDAALADFDGDRLAELYLPSHDAHAYRRATFVDGGNAVEWGLHGDAPGPDPDVRRTHTFDLLGVGSPGLLVARTDGEPEGTYRVDITAPDSVPDLLSAVTDGFGATNTIEYGTAFDGDTFRHLECEDGHTPIAPRRSMVRTVERLFDGDTAAVVAHRYRGSCHDGRNRNFSFFQEHESSSGIRIGSVVEFHGRVVEHRDNYAYGVGGDAAGDVHTGQQVFRQAPTRIESYRVYPGEGRSQHDVQHTTFDYFEGSYDRDTIFLDLSTVAIGRIAPRYRSFTRHESLGTCSLEPSGPPCELDGQISLDSSVTTFADFNDHGIAQKITKRRGEQCSVETVDHVAYEHTSLVDHTLLEAGLIVSAGGGGDGSGANLDCDVTSAHVAPVRQEVTFTRDPDTWEIRFAHWQEANDEEELLAEFGYEHGQLNYVSQTALTAAGAFGTTNPSRSWSREFDSTGIFVSKEVNALGHETTHWWHPDLAVNIRTTGANGVSIDRMFDELGRGRSVQAFGSDGAAASPPQTVDFLRVVPDEDDQLLPSPMLLRERTPEGSETLREFDEHGELVRSEWDVDEALRVYATRRIQRALGQTHVFESLPAELGDSPGAEGETILDPTGRIVAVHPAPADVGVSNYHYEGRETRIESPTGDTVSYVSNGAGLLESVVDETGVRTCYYFGGLSRLRDVVVNPEAGFCDGSLPADSKERTSTHFEYSDLGHPTRRDLPGSGLETLDYNAFGEPWRVVTEAGSSSIVRDDLGRTLHRYDSDGSNAHFSWDVSPECSAPIGSLCRTSSSDGAEREFRYDALGRVEESAMSIDGYTLRGGYRYDAFGRVARVWHEGGPTVQNEYDAVGALSRVSVMQGPELWRATERDVGGTITGSVFGNGAKLSRTVIDGLFREMTLDAPNMTPAFPGAETSSVTIDSASVVYDVAGRLESREVPHLGLLEVFAYEGDQLVGASTEHDGESLGSWSQTYFPTGAVETRSDLGEFEYGDAAHPLGVTQAGDVGYSYGPHGRQEERAGDVFSWNVRGRLRTVTGDSSVSYAYDAQDARVRKVESVDGVDETTYYGAGEELEFSADAATRTIYVGGAEGPVAALRSADGFGSYEVLYMHNNELGSSSVVTNAAGEVVQRQDFDAFGRSRGPLWNGKLTELSADLDVGFTGHRVEEAYGLIDMGGRHYDPHIARFASPDPVTADPLRAVGYDPFAYVLNRPLRFTDPTGFEPESDLVFDDHHVKGDVSPAAAVAEFEEEDGSLHYHLQLPAESHVTNFRSLSTGNPDDKAALQLELDSMTVDDSIGTDEFAERYLPEPPPENPDRITLPRVPLPDTPALIRVAYPFLGDLSGNTAIGMVEDLVNAQSELTLAEQEISDGVVRISRGDTLNGLDGVAYGAGRWGHTFLTVYGAVEVAAGAGGKVSPGGAVDDVAEGGADIALGLGNHLGRKGSKTLANFAGHTNSAWYRQWADRGIASLRPGETLMSESFLLRGMQNARTIHFNLDGVSPAAYKAFAKNPSFGYGNITNWELHQLLTSGLGGKARFYGKGGVEVGIDAVRAMFQ